MKIIFDYKIFYQQKIGGISNYYFNLGEELLRYNHEVKFVCPIHKNKYFFFLNIIFSVPSVLFPSTTIISKFLYFCFKIEFIVFKKSFFVFKLTTMIENLIFFLNFINIIAYML